MCWRLIVLLLFPAFAAAESDAPPQVAQGRIERLPALESQHVPARHVDVWLPPDYPRDAPYAVLYAHDGQMLFDATRTWNGQEWRMDEVAARLIGAGETRPFLVVGIWNAGASRHAEYFPEPVLEALTAEARGLLDGARRGDAALFAELPYSRRYLRFLVEELKPAIDARYATSPAREDTFVLGSSMGGLIALHALTAHPEVFGGAACLSTHWPGAFAFEGNPIPDAMLRWLETELPAPGRHRLWFDHGTETLDAHYPPLQARVDDLLRARGWTEPQWRTAVYPGAAHDETAWAARLHAPLQHLLDAAGSNAAAAEAD